MENNNQTTQPVQQSSVNPIPAPPAPTPVSQTPPPPQPDEPKKTGGKNYMLIASVVIVIVVILLAAGLYIYMSLPYGASQDTTSYLTPTPQAEAIVEEDQVVIENENDLEGFLVELAEADEGLDKELQALQKEASF